MDPNRARSSSSSSLARSASPPVPSSLRRPLSTDNFTPQTHLPPRSLRQSNSNTSLSSSASPTRALNPRRSSGNLRKPVATRDWAGPTLEQLVRQEEHAARAAAEGSGSGAGTGAGASTLGLASGFGLQGTPARGLGLSSPGLARSLTGGRAGHPSRPSFVRSRSGRSTPGASNSGSPRIEVDGTNGEWTRFAAGLQSRRSSWAEHHPGGGGGGEGDYLPEPESAVLFPPHYGRPGPSPSPDIFATLLQPILNLSRPSSPALPLADPTSLHPSPSRAPSPLPRNTHNLSDSPPSLSTPSTLRPPAPSRSGSTLAPLALPAAVQEAPADRSSSSLPAHFPPRRSSDPGPTVESQGFVLYIGSLVAWWAFLGWGLLPDAWLEGAGWHWYPNREWALLFPAWTIMLAAFVYSSYIALNIFITPPLDSLHTLTDPQAYILPFPVDPPTAEVPHPLLANSVLLPPDAVPPVHDLPVGLVNRVVFGDHRRRGRR